MISVSKIHYCIDMGQYKSIQVIKREPSTHATCGFAIPSPSGRAREGLELGKGATPYYIYRARTISKRHGGTKNAEKRMSFWTGIEK